LLSRISTVYRLGNIIVTTGFSGASRFTEDVSGLLKQSFPVDIAFLDKLLNTLHAEFLEIFTGRGPLL